jgi:hypothetical protein
MNTALMIFVAGSALAGLFFLTRRALRAYLRYRGRAVVICPETRRPVAVRVDAALAAWAATEGAVDLRLKNCARWPERAGCGQDCVRQIELAPENCMVRTMMAKWYEGKSCVYCGRAFGPIGLTDHQPVLLDLDRKTVEWGDIPPEELYDALTTHLPVCWNCHVAETFRREHPDLMVECSRKTGVHV